MDNLNRIYYKHIVIYYIVGEYSYKCITKNNIKLFLSYNLKTAYPMILSPTSIPMILYLSQIIFQVPNFSRTNHFM